MRTSILLALIAALGLFVPSASAQTPDSGIERYRVRKGDTLELLAAEYYGNRIHKIYIMVENGLDHERALKPGERLRIPVSERITTAVGDTLEALAESYLGSASRAKYLAEFNNLEEDTTLALGQEILIPLRVSYRAKGNEKLRDVALGLFANAKQATLLRDYNGLESDDLQPGQVIIVPVPKLEVQVSKRKPADADSAARAGKRAQMTRQAQEALPTARAAWQAGEFTLVKHHLTKLDIDYLDTDLASRVGILLGATYIAFDDEDSALALFARVLSRAPELTLDPREHSPKVRKAWERAVQARP